MSPSQPDSSYVRDSSDYLTCYTPTPIDASFAGKHIITVEQFQRPDLDTLFNNTFALRERLSRRDPTLTQLCDGRVMATLFFEASTRTDMSFQAAMRRLGGEVVSASNGVRFSSVYKGENLADTVRAAGCYADIIVLRHPELGSAYQAAHYLDMLNSRIVTPTIVINGGDGPGEHPTQALLDLFTIVDKKRGINNLTITMVGDLLHGRTVHSLAKLIALYGVSNTRLCFVSPNSLRMPDEILHFLREHHIDVFETDELLAVLGESDVVYWTRVQEERFADKAAYDAIRDDFIMTPAILQAAKADMILMHPLPRKYEMGTPIDHDNLDIDPRTVYFQQMENGMFVRMALLAMVLGHREL